MLLMVASNGKHARPKKSFAVSLGLMVLYMCCLYNYQYQGTEKEELLTQHFKKIRNMTSRRLWLDEQDEITDVKLIHRDETETYETVFQRFSSKPPSKSLTSITSNALVVGQELILTCLLLARHRIALWEEEEEELGFSRNPLGNLDHRLAVSSACFSMALVLVVLHSKSESEEAYSQSRQRKFKQRLTDAIFMAILLRFLAAVLRTLTASYSSNTVRALAGASFLLHLLACDYSYANGFDDGKPALNHNKRPIFRGGTVSLTTAFFGTTLLASRLEHNVAVYIFVSSSVILFAWYPDARHRVSVKTRNSNAHVPLAITLMFSAATFVLLETVEVVLICFSLTIICFFAPFWRFTLQRSKLTLRGPWDIIHIN